MCLAVPARIKEKTGANLAVVDVMGVTRTISLDLVPSADIDDWVLMHAGFAIDVVDEQFAAETIELIHSVQFSDDGGTVTGAAPVPFEGTMSGGMEASRAMAIASGAYKPKDTENAVDGAIDDTSATEAVRDEEML